MYDCRALRVIVDDGDGRRSGDAIDCCYRLAAAAQKLWKPVMREFDDYIANPKGSGYQALHVVVRDRCKVAMEVQVRGLKAL